MSKRTLPWILFASDWVICIVGWAVFFSYRKTVENPGFEYLAIVDDVNFLYGISIIPVCWLAWFGFLGHYERPHFRTFAQWLNQTALAVFFGGLVLLFTVLIDDYTLDYVTYVESFTVLIGIHLLLLLVVRLLLFGWWQKVSKSKHHQLKALLFTNHKLKNTPEPPLSVDFISTRLISDEKISLRKLLNYDFVFVHTEDSQELEKALQVVAGTGERVPLCISDETYRSSSREWSVAPLPGNRWLTTRQKGWSPFEANLKRSMDVLVSMSSLIFLSPLFLYCAWRVRGSSEGPIFFTQERVGRYGKTFDIVKFRSMVVDAEVDGPALSSDDDQRQTDWGRTMRKWRFDELPQFYNVMKGDMSLVGPRPERPYYILQLKDLVPGYEKILRVRPGITSWGQIKYGYASSISEMVQRLRYDMLYVDNVSILLDLQILYHTFKVVLKGAGK